MNSPPGSIFPKIDKKTCYLPLPSLTIPGLIYLLILSLPEHLVMKAQNLGLEGALGAVYSTAVSATRG